MAAPEEEPPAGAPDWIVTFTDLVSLLVAFFVLLMTFSSLDNWDSFQIRGDLLGIRGTLDDFHGGTLIDPPHEDIMAAIDAMRGAESPHSRPPEALVENLEEMGQKRSDDHIEVDLKALRDGLVMHFDERATFSPGSAEPNPELRRALGELGRILQHYGYTVTVEGFTDDAFQPTPEFPTAEALSCARAAAAAEAIVSQSELSPLMIQIAGAGARRPLNENSSPSERKANRRVEVKILSMSRGRARAYEERGG